MCKNSHHIWLSFPQSTIATQVIYLWKVHCIHYLNYGLYITLKPQFWFGFFWENWYFKNHKVHFFCLDDRKWQKIIRKNVLPAKAQCPRGHFELNLNLASFWLYGVLLCNVGMLHKQSIPIWTGEFGEISKFWIFKIHVRSINNVFRIMIYKIIHSVTTEQ